MTKDTTDPADNAPDEEPRSDPISPDAAFEGPAAENAYPESRTITIDGVTKPANQALRYYNRVHGLVDPAARKRNDGDD